MSQKLRERYNAFAGFYDRNEYLGEILGIRILRKKLVQNVSGKVLEIGVGTGKNLSYYSDSCEIYGIDFSSGMLDVCSQKAEKLRKDIQFYLMSAENLAFPDNYFDCVTDSLNLCTYENPVQVLREAKRVCKKDGKILLLEHGRSNIGLIAKLQDLKAERHARIAGCYWNRNIISIINQSGLEIENIESYLFDIFLLLIAKPNYK